MADRHGNATSDENNLAEPWRDWFVLCAFGTQWKRRRAADNGNRIESRLLHGSGNPQVMSVYEERTAQPDRPSCSVPRVTAHSHPIVQKRESGEKARAQSIW
jgi:hypothetical protein